tara:strand:+ start:357 stop:554 length:198 start_codon:yes stop_codon:yes gene_type:complete
MTTLQKVTGFPGIAIFVLASVLTLSACDNSDDTPMEKAGEALDDMGDDLEDAVEDAGDEIEDATD